jgi:ribA/ribD-fused uncharacterized protein
MGEKFTLFFSGPFNQCYPLGFTIDGINFSSAEQYMMAEKALLFENVKIYEKIMLEEDPALQKVLGREITNFDKDKWDSICQEVVYNANYAKFTQHPELYESLIGTYGTEIVFAAANDSIWGIGLSENDPRALDRNQWNGLNLLGNILTQLRENLITEKEKFN